MNDVRHMLDAALQDEPAPRALDLDALEQAGRRRIRRRRLTFAGAATASIVFVTAAALTLPGAYAGSGEATPDTGYGPAAGDEDEPPAEPIDYTLPELDPDASYAWRTKNATESDTTTALSEIVVNHIEDVYPDFQTVGWDAEARSDNSDAWVATDPRGDLAPLKFHLYDAELAASDKLGNPHEEPVHTQPIYAAGEMDLLTPLEPHEAPKLVLRGEDTTHVDSLGIQIFPAGGYLEGTDEATQLGIDDPRNGYLAEGCDDYEITDSHEGTDDDRLYEFDCGETTTESGAKVLSVTRSTTYLDAMVVYVQHTVVIYRTDGSAVRLSSDVQVPLGWTQGTPFDGVDTTLDTEYLAELGLTIPEVPFE